jgi:DNA-binding NarL/FixJ family response regulator
MNRDENLATRMLAHGASAFVSKESHPNEIINTLEHLVRGMKVITKRQKELLHESEFTNRYMGNANQQMLTDREYQVLNFIARGLKSGEIASSLSLSKNTISNHRNNLLKKLNMRNNSDLTRYAIQQGIL